VGSKKGGATDGERLGEAVQLGIVARSGVVLTVAANGTSDGRWGV
jgi:hypothetical protein